MLMPYKIDHEKSLRILCDIFAEVLCGIYEIDVLEKVKFAIIVVNQGIMLNGMEIIKLRVKAFSSFIDKFAVNLFRVNAYSNLY